MTLGGPGRKARGRQQRRASGAGGAHRERVQRVQQQLRDLARRAAHGVLRQHARAQPARGRGASRAARGQPRQGPGGRGRARRPLAAGAGTAACSDAQGQSSPCLPRLGRGCASTRCSAPRSGAVKHCLQRHRGPGRAHAGPARGSAGSARPCLCEYSTDAREAQATSGFKARSVPAAGLAQPAGRPWHRAPGRCRLRQAREGHRRQQCRAGQRRGARVLQPRRPQPGRGLQRAQVEQAEHSV